MSKIVMIGAGSAGFCRTLVQDILCFESLRDSEIVLFDIDEARLETTRRAMEAMREQHGLPCRFTATTDRRKALSGADFAISMIQVGGLAPYKIDLEIPLKYGVDQCVGDTLNPGGVFRGLRHVPALLELMRDMEELCPGVLFMNYANPMAICTWAMQREFPHIRSVGLCHGVQHTTNMLCAWLGVPAAECDVLTAGINHMAWFLQFRHRGRDLYPDMWRKLEEEGPIQWESYRFEMMKATGYFMTESSGHLSEYLPYFRGRRDLQDLFGGPNLSGETGGYYKSCVRGLKQYNELMAAYADGREPVPYEAGLKSVEFAGDIMDAAVTGNITRIAGNVLNKGYIPNLPDNCCVEVPVYIDRLGLHGTHVGALPPQCAALNRSNIAVQELAVKAAIEGDREAVYHACFLDPLTAAVLAPHEIRNMVDELLAAQEAWLPQFRGKPNRAPGATIGRLATGAERIRTGAAVEHTLSHYD